MKGMMKEFLSLYLHQPTTKAEARESIGFSKSSQITEVWRHFTVISEMTFLYIRQSAQDKAKATEIGLVAAAYMSSHFSKKPNDMILWPENLWDCMWT